MTPCDKEHKPEDARIVENEYQQKFWQWSCCGLRVPRSVIERPAEKKRPRVAEGGLPESDFTRALYE